MNDWVKAKTYNDFTQLFICFLYGIFPYKIIYEFVFTSKGISEIDILGKTARNQKLNKRK